jgi:tripartite ATP-independent transporter DctP family solute receptor
MKSVRLLRLAQVLALLLVFAALFASAPVPTLAQTVAVKQVKLALTSTTDSIPHKSALEFAKVAGERSGGSLKIDVFPRQFGASDEELWQHAQNGTVEIDQVNPAYLANMDERFNVTELPFFFASKVEARKVTTGTTLTSFYDAFVARKGVRVLGTAEVGFRHITNSKRPIRTPEDLKGLKFRTPQWKNLITYFSAIGANPVPMAWSEVYTGLQTGTIDGQENALTTIWNEKVYEVQKYVSLTGHTYQLTGLVVNEAWWKSLSDDQRKALNEGMKAYQDTTNRLTDEQEVKIVGWLKEKGLQVNEADKTAFQAPAKTVWKELMPKQQELIDTILAEIKK